MDDMFYIFAKFEDQTQSQLRDTKRQILASKKLSFFYLTNTIEFDSEILQRSRKYRPLHVIIFQYFFLKKNSKFGENQNFKNFTILAFSPDTSQEQR